MPINKPITHAVNYWGDKCGCGWYRMGFPNMALQTMLGGQFHFMSTDTEHLILDPNFYLHTNVTVVRIQRWFGHDKLKIVQEFLKPLSKKIGFWLIYQIDDVLIYDQIPKYNIAREAFNPQKIGETPKQIMELCDFITVTTPEIKDLYKTYFNLPDQKFIVIPNYLPRWWIGESFNLGRQMYQWKQHRQKPNIAFCCSTNHFDVQNANNGVDDFTHLIPWIKANIGKLNFSFVGGVPQQLIPEAKAGKIYHQPPSDIFNYPREIQNRQIDLLVAPLLDNNFNKCKSNIKYLEFSALGIPMAGQNICTYNKYTDLVFNDGNELDNIINALFFSNNSQKTYYDIIINQRKIIDGTNQPGTGWWLEKNIQKYYNLYSIPQKTLEIDIELPKEIDK